MTYEIVAPAGVWALAGISLAFVLLAAARRAEEGAAARLRWRAAGLAALGGAAVPSAVQYAVTDGRHFWAGVLLLAAAAGWFLRSFTLQRTEAAAAFSFREKSAMAGMAAIAAVYGWSTFNILREPLSLRSAFGWLAASSVVMVLVMIAFHLVFALMRKPEEIDERDRQVAWRSAQNGYVVLAVGVWGAMTLVFIGAAPAVVVYALLGSFVCAELVRLASELAYYRLDL